MLMSELNNSSPIKKLTAEDLLQMSADGCRIDDHQANLLIQDLDPNALMAAASLLRDQGHGSAISYSRKVFIPLTKLCRDVCHYCTFAQTPKRGKANFLSLEEVLDIARAGAEAGCREALFTLGDNPEARYSVAREELDLMGQASTLSYLNYCADEVFKQTGLLPHANPGLMDPTDIAALRETCVSQGIMLESASERLCEKGQPHYGSPDKLPQRRLDTIRWAGEAAVPFTSGILIGIGETRLERIESLLALRRMHDSYGHIQEIIIQNFQPKADTKMAHSQPVSTEDLCWTIAIARLLFGPDMNIQTPPNLNSGELESLVAAGVNDWGGVSPVTPDHVNPEAPWPTLERLSRETEATGKILIERLAIYPSYVRDSARWAADKFSTPLKHSVDAQGFPREEQWSPGTEQSVPDWKIFPTMATVRNPGKGSLDGIINRAIEGQAPDENEIVKLFSARGRDYKMVCDTADKLRQELVGDRVTYVVNRNINYTNVCYYHCGFCAFSKGRTSVNLRDKPYNLEIEEIQRRAREATGRGATEVCMQGGIHPAYTGDTYLEICRAVKAAVPDMHVHAFSPLEVWQGAATLDISIQDFLCRLKEAGLGSLPGTAAEVLDDQVRAVLCPDKINTSQWLEVMETAHKVGLRSTATIMFGHVDAPEHWARHLLRVLELQSRTGGFTEFVPLPFVHMEAPIYLKGKARRGPTFRECILMHAVARLVFHDKIPNIQASWVKLGLDGLSACLQAGVNDVGGSLMNETITRSAGAVHGQEILPEQLERTIRAAGRVPAQRTTFYREPSDRQKAAAYGAPALSLNQNTPLRQMAKKIPRVKNEIYAEFITKI